nr:unnamed protein product [Haemonchus contortus]
MGIRIHTTSNQESVHLPLTKQPFIEKLSSSDKINMDQKLTSSPSKPAHSPFRTSLIILGAVQLDRQEFPSTDTGCVCVRLRVGINFFRRLRHKTIRTGINS